MRREWLSRNEQEGPHMLKNVLLQSSTVGEEESAEFKKEVERWIKEGILTPCKEVCNDVAIDDGGPINKNDRANIVLLEIEQPFDMEADDWRSHKCRLEVCLSTCICVKKIMEAKGKI